MLYYVLQVLVLQFIFLLFYRWFLRRETYFQWNRIYLLLSVLLSFLLPLIRLDWFRSQDAWTETLAPVVIGSARLQSQIHQQVEAQYTSQLLWIYIAGVVLFGLLFLFKLYQIFSLIKKHKKIKKPGYTLVLLPAQKEVFSFMQYIFVDEHLLQNNETEILAHERVHIREKHWLDLLFFEWLKILFWFDPLLWMYQKEAGLLHEFIADRKTLQKRSVSAYFNQILQETFQVRKVSFVNQFYQPKLLKKRIMMLKRKKSTRLSLAKYVAFAVIIVGLSLLLDACKQESGTEEILTKEEFQQLKSDKVAKISVTKHPDKVTVYTHSGDVMVYYPQNKAEMIDALNIQVTKVKVDNDDQTKEVAFQFLKNPPVFEGCEGLQGNEAKDCFSKKIQRFVSMNFNTSLADSLGLQGERVKILTQFTFDKQGKVTTIRARSKYKELEKEAKRVIAMLPQVQPGQQNGEPVKVTYTLPIIFKVE